MPKHDIENSENSPEYLTDTLINSETQIKKKCRICCYFIYLSGYSVSLVLGFYIGYTYRGKESN